MDASDEKAKTAEQLQVEAQQKELQRLQQEQALSRSVDTVTWIRDTLLHSQYPGEEAEQVMVALQYLAGLKASLEAARASLAVPSGH